MSPGQSRLDEIHSSYKYVVGILGAELSGCLKKGALSSII